MEPLRAARLPRSRRLTFLWLRSVGLGVGASLAGGLVFALAPYRAVQGGAGHLLAWIGMLLPLSLWAWERRLYWLTAAALATIPLSGQVHLALGALPFVFAYALVRGGDRRWAAARSPRDLPASSSGRSRSAARSAPRARSPRSSATRPSWRTSCRGIRATGSRRSSSSAGSCRSWRSSGSFCIAARASVSSSVPGRCFRWCSPSGPIFRATRRSGRRFRGSA